MRLVAVVLVVSTLAVVVAEEHPFQDDANGLMAFEAPTHRQIDFEDDQGFYLQSQDDVGFFKGNTLPRPSGLNTLGGFNDPVPSNGFEPNPAIGGPAPFTVPELTAPIHFPDFGPLVPRPQPAPKSPVANNSSASHTGLPDPQPAPPAIATTRAKDNKPVRRPNRQPKRKPKRRPNRIPVEGRPQRQTRPQRESVEDGPAGGLRGGKGTRGRIRGREPSVSGFMKSFRRLIRQGL